jgi:aspartyl-tRNA synthetase
VLLDSASADSTSVRSPHDTAFGSRDIGSGPAQLGQAVALTGFISKVRNKNDDYSYFELQEPQECDLLPGKAYTVTFRVSRGSDIRNKLQGITASSPVAARGTIVDINEGRPWRVVLDLEDIHYFNQFPKDIIVSKGVRFPPAARHLQMRFHPELRARLRFRNSAQSMLSSIMDQHQFQLFDTPTLFKPTAEGAREFLVPLRQAGTAYALPQSPQQYKQVLMASGFSKYYQWARCFRDEDLRADRQPEFTQVNPLLCRYPRGSPAVKLTGCTARF